jgi:hypothetical protein
LATDFPAFTRYFCAKEQAANSNVTFLSSCHEKDVVSLSDGKHINDVALPFEAYSLKELEEDVRFVVATLVSDWLALALAQNVYGIGGSTFRESASYEFFFDVMWKGFEMFPVSSLAQPWFYYYASL